MKDRWREEVKGSRVGGRGERKGRRNGWRKIDRTKGRVAWRKGREERRKIQRE